MVVVVVVVAVARTNEMMESSNDAMTNMNENC